MNIFEIIKTSTKEYITKIPEYFMVTAIYVVSTLSFFGVFVAFLLINCLISHHALIEREALWNTQLDYSIIIWINSLLAIITFSYLQFCAIGAYINGCVKISSRNIRDCSIMKFVEYMQENARTFFLISIIPGSVTLLIIIILLKMNFIEIGLSINSIISETTKCIVVWFFVHALSWFSYVSKIIKNKQPLDAMVESYKIIKRRPVASLTFISIFCLAATIPTITVLFYPVYIFLFFNPVCTISTIMFYEKTVKG